MYDPSFDTGIHVVYEELESKIKEKADKVFVEAVQKVGIDVDAERLKYILHSSTRLYTDGYIKGYNDAKSECSEIIRCNDCKHAAPTMFAEGEPYSELQNYEDVRMLMIAGAAIVDYYNGNAENSRVKNMIYTCQEIEDKFMGDIGKRLLAVSMWVNDDEFKSKYQQYKGNIVLKFIDDYLKRRENYRNNGLCQNCGGVFTGVFRKVCSQCGIDKDY